MSSDMFIQMHTCKCIKQAFAIDQFTPQDFIYQIFKVKLIHI